MVLSKDLLHDVDLRVVLGVRVRVNLEAEKSQEFGEESLVHVFAHLIEDKPVSNTAVGDVVLDMSDVFVLAQIPSKSVIE